MKLQFPTSTEFQLEESNLMIRISKNSISVFKYKFLMKHIMFLSIKRKSAPSMYLASPGTDILKLNSVEC